MTTSGTVPTWAAADEHAKVINMSLGGPDFAGTDPLEEAVNTLTAQTGALFVIAAGNSGDAQGTIESPGNAAAALTVGAVDKSGHLAPFSSRGPRSEDEAVKPDLASVSFGVEKWPHDNDQPLTRTVTYDNNGTSALTLNLSLPGDTAGVYSLSAGTLAVPAGGTASVPAAGTTSSFRTTRAARSPCGSRRAGTRSAPTSTRPRPATAPTCPS